MRMTSPEAARLGPMRIPGPVKPRTYQIIPAPKKSVATQAAINPYDVFNAPRPYDPKTLHQTALTGYNEDVANSTKLAAMGDLTPAQIDAQAASRAQQQTALGSSLAAALGSIQRVSVGSGNAGAAGLTAADAATSAGAGSIAGAPPPAALPVPAVQGVIAAQTAGEGNIYGGNIAAAYSAADQAAKAAYAAGDTLKATQATQQAQRLAQMLTGVASVSTREATMTDANSKVDVANTGTHLAIWTGIEGRRLQAQALGAKKAEAKAALDERNYEAQLGSTDRRAIAATQAETSRGNAQLSADTSTANNQRTVDGARQRALITARAKAAKAAGVKPPTPAQRLAVNKQINKIMGSPGGTKTPAGQITTGYKITLAPGPDSLPNATDKTIPIDAKTGASLKVGDKYQGQIIKGLAPTTKTGQAGVKDQPSTWTKWKRAHAAVMTTFQMSRTEATQYMAASGYPAPKS